MYTWRPPLDRKGIIRLRTLSLILVDLYHIPYNSINFVYKQRVGHGEEITYVFWFLNFQDGVYTPSVSLVVFGLSEFQTLLTSVMISLGVRV